MSAMAISEATIDLSDTSKWECGVHQVWVKTGKECFFCLYEEIGDAMFS